MSRSVFRRLHRLLGPSISGVERTRRAEAHRVRLGAFLPMNLMTNRVQIAPPRPIHVGIVGGGFAGLAAATALKNLQCQVTIFEARNKLGGRVESSSTFVPNRILEKGAELIGSNHVVWTFLARAFGLGLSVITEDDHYIGERLRLPARFGGRRLTPAEARSLYDSMKRALGDLTLKSRAITDPYNPWLAHDSSKLDRTTLESWIKGITSDPLVRAALEFEFANHNTVSTDHQSLLAVLTQIAGGGGEAYWEDTEVYRCENGNDALATSLSQGILNSSPAANIHLSEAVTDVDIEERKGVTIRSHSTNSSRTPLTTFCDYAIIATPPGVWSKISFGGRPFPLPPIQCGPAAKFLSETKSRYWVRQGDAPSGFDDALGMLWEGTDNQMGGTGIDLTVFVGGPWASRVGSGSADAYFRPRIEALLPGFDGKQGSVQSYYANWPKEEFIGTGYSCAAPGQVMTLLLWMQEGIAKRLFLAGEHVSPPFFGYMEGALQSGLAAACRIAAAAGLSLPASFGSLNMTGVNVQIPSLAAVP